MKTLLALSPHLDDAAFSISPLLAELSAIYRVVVATPFAGSVAEPQGFALACQLDKGLSPEIDYMELRRGEDTAWAEGIGAKSSTAILKKLPTAATTAPQSYSLESIPTITSGPTLKRGCAQRSRYLAGADSAAAWHRRACRSPLASANDRGHGVQRVPLAYYCDQPYCAKQGLAPAPAGFPKPGLEALKFTAKLASVDRSLEATTAYASQIPFQFGTFEKMRNLLTAAWKTLSIFFPAEANARESKKSFT